MHQEQHNITSVVFFVKMPYLNLIMRKHGSNPSQGSYYKIFNGVKVGKHKGRLKRLSQIVTQQLNAMRDSGLDPGSEEEH